MTQQELAEKTGIKRTEINAYCRGRKLLGDKNAPVIAAALDIPVERLRPRSESSAIVEVLGLLRAFRAEAELSRGAQAEALRAIDLRLRAIERRLPPAVEPTREAES